MLGPSGQAHSLPSLKGESWIRVGSSGAVVVCMQEDFRWIFIYLFKHTNTCMRACSVTSVVSDSLQPHRLYPARLPCPWDSPGMNTGVGCHTLLQGDLPYPGLKPRSPSLQAVSLPLSHRGSPPHTYIYT